MSGQSLDRRLGKQAEESTNILGSLSSQLGISAGWTSLDSD
jgi:hypothetical protein